MSLVNDMLRDLDQRRNSSESASASMKLMPASDMPVEKKNRILLILAVVLVLAVSGLAYLWSQQAGVSEPRRLNISTPVATTPAPTSVPTPVEPENETSAAEPAQQLAGRQQQAAPAVAEPATIEPAPVTADRSVAVATGEGPEEGPEKGPEAISGSVPAQPVRESAATRSAVPESESSAPATSLAQAQASAPENQNVAPGTAASTPRSVVNQPAPAAIKNDAQVSPDQADTMAVQAALRMIADNDVTGAYAHLEQHIINNRYAHQSRETYAKLLMNEGHLLAAYNLVESGLGLAPNHPGFKKVKARILIADGQIADAVSLLSSRAPSVSEDLEYHDILATAQLASRDYRGALISYTGLVQQDQSQGKWWYGYAASQDSLGNTNAARQAYNRAVQQPNLSPNLRRRSQERLATLSE